MKQQLILAALSAFSPCLAFADSFTINSDNSSLKFTRDDAVFNLGVPSDPVQLARKLEWTVDGRRILVYPSSPSSFIDISHIHTDSHVTASQMHAQGPLLGFATNGSTGTVMGGIVYTVAGSAAGSGVSRIWEKVDIVNKSGSDVPLDLTGLGFKPTQTSLEVPDLNGVTVTGTTVAFFQGNTSATSIIDPPFGPVTVLPVVAFSGFNTLLNQKFTLPAGATLTMITELNVGTAPANIATQPAGDTPVINPNSPARPPRPDR